MQANTITLPVDIANNGTIVNQDFSRFEEQVNRTTYVGPSHTLASPDTMQLYRTLPVRSGASLGASKVTVKFTRHVGVVNADGTTSQRPLIIEASASIPVGATAAQTKEARQKLIAVLDSDVVAGSLMDLGNI